MCLVYLNNPVFRISKTPALSFALIFLAAIIYPGLLNTLKTLKVLKIRDWVDTHYYSYSLGFMKFKDFKS